MGNSYFTAGYFLIKMPEDGLKKFIFDFALKYAKYKHGNIYLRFRAQDT